MGDRATGPATGLLLVFRRTRIRSMRIRTLNASVLTVNDKLGFLIPADLEAGINGVSLRFEMFRRTIGSAFL